MIFRLVFFSDLKLQTSAFSSSNQTLHNDGAVHRKQNRESVAFVMFVMLRYCSAVCFLEMLSTNITPLLLICMFSLMTG